MPYYWYAIVPSLPLRAERSPVPVALAPIAYRDLTAVVAEVARHRVLPTTSAVWDHHRVIEHLSEVTEARVLPLRFGTVLPDLDAIFRQLTNHYEQWQGLLKTLAGYGELAIKVLWNPPPISVPAPTAVSPYLAKRLNQRRLREVAKQQADAIDRQLANLAARRQQSILPVPELLMAANYLVARHQTTAFRQVVRLLMDENTTYRWLCTGPWPPYHFSSVEDA